MTFKRYTSLAEFFDNLSQFEAGGRGLAMALAKDSPVPPSETRAVGGAEESVEWFRSRLNTKDERPSMLFLVGAPGNGKSFLLSKVLVDLPGVSKQGRDVRSFSVPETDTARSLLVVNDASAPSEHGAPGQYLRVDMEKAISTSSNVHVNVNRGVLNQELRSNSSVGPVTSLFRWLSTSELNFEDDYLRMGPGDSSSSVRVARLTHEGLEFDLVAVYMDFYSIFEKQPVYEFCPSGEWAGFPRLPSGQAYSIVRPRSAIRASRRHWEETPAGGLLSSTLEHIEPLLKSEHVGGNVLVDNLSALCRDEVFCGFLSILRNAEIATSQHVSFRELWTAIALAVIGDRESRASVLRDDIGQVPPSRWMDSLKDACPKEQPARMQWLMSVASARTHQSLFGAIQVPGEEKIDRALSPILFLTTRVDPVKDVRALEQDDGGPGTHVTPVAEAMRGQIGDTSIVDLLSQILSDIDVSLVVSELDRVVDESVRELLEADFRDKPFVDRADLESVLVWYGDYLSRLLSMSIGRTAYQEEIQVWVDAWLDAKDRHVSPRLRESIVNLLLPKFNMQDRDNAGERLITLMSARTGAVTSPPDKPRFAVRLGTHPALRSSVSGDSFSIQMIDNSGNLLLDIVADFDFVREALACESWYSAFTDNSNEITPKIERFRAQLLRDSDFLSNLRLINGTKIERVRLN